MKIYLIKKYRYRIYKSEQIVQCIFGESLFYDEKGAPKLANGYISISDTKNYWACAVSNEPVGLDLEEKSRIVKSGVARHLNQEEIDYLKPLSEGSLEWKDEFLAIWVKKEAYMKLKGEGMRMGLSSFSVVGNDIASSFEYKRLVFGLAPSTDFEVEELEYDAPFEKSCLDCAAYLLETKSLSSKKLAEKLKERGYKEEDIELAISKLAGYGYVNDESYAASLAKKYFEEGKAPLRIALELQKKGILKEDAKKASDEYLPYVWEKANEIAEKMPRETDKEKAKLARKLASLGYPQSVIYDILTS